MFRTPSHLPESSRAQIAESLNARLADSLDLYSQIKAAHWNIKGPLFSSLHPLFDSFATDVAGYMDEMAERLVTLGGLTRGTVRLAAAASQLDEYPIDTVRDLEHASHLAVRIESWLSGMRETRQIAESKQDTDTVDMLTVMITAFEKHAWFLRATLES
ncbi:MAG TPA: DNA starvation/stationary phase protection protein Dps [Candidatus Saccharimonadales bacterium]|nr:DNA starvation/stationary phase protection protein Dps [Candidatus Saccharimonadales bacterium]